MVKIQKEKTNKILAIILIVAVAGLLIFEFLKEKPQPKLLTAKMPSIDYVELNLKILRQYNTPAGSVISDFRDLFAGQLSAPEYSIIRYDLTSALFLLLLPLVAMFGILMSLGVSKRTMVMIMALFGAFTVLPLILI